MNTVEMLKTLTESGKDFGTQFFITLNNTDEPMICFLRPSAGSIEFRLFREWDRSYISDSVILYADYNWIEINKENADVYLKGNYNLL